MDNGMIIGIDIGKYDVQVSCLKTQGGQAETISTRMGEETYEIPLCLFKRLDSTAWYYGNKARQNMYSEKGVYIADLWEGTLGNREIVLEDETCSYESLMTIFIEKLFALIVQSGYTQDVRALVFTMENITHEKIIHLKNIVRELPIDSKQVFYVDYKESFGAYATRAPKELWNHEVFLFYYTERRLKAFELRVNQKLLPFQIKIGEIDYGELDYSKEDLETSKEAGMDMDSRFQATVQELFAKKIVSSVYLIGDGFQPGWMKDSLRMLCRGRRVFQGNNLFTKGACYVGEWYLKLQNPVGEYRSSQKLICDVRIPVLNQKREKDYLYVAKAGEPWYHASMDTECLLEAVSDNQEHKIQIEMIYYGLDAQGARGAEKIEELELLEFPNRPPKASRVHIHVEFVDEYTGKIVVKDMGLGEFYLPSELSWNRQFPVKERGEGS